MCGTRILSRMVTGIFLCLVIAALAATAFAAAGPAVKVTDQKTAIQAFLKVQLPFVKNEGQIADETVKYYVHTYGGSFYVRENGEMAYLFMQPPEKKDRNDLKRPGLAKGIKTWALKERLVDAKGLTLSARDPSKTQVNYFTGTDRSKWKTNIPTYNTLSLGEVYQGITLSLRASGKSVEKVFTVAPGADPGKIRLAVEGAKALKVNDRGELAIETEMGPKAFSKPVAYQQKDGKRVDVAATYRLNGDTYAFQVGEYDRALPLVIDPFIVSMAFGGFFGQVVPWLDRGFGIALGPGGSIYITGTSINPLFEDRVVDNAFVTKCNADGSLAYTTYLGVDSRGAGITIDASGNPWIVGSTVLSTIPFTEPVPTDRGDTNTFVARLNSSTGVLEYAAMIVPDPSWPDIPAAMNSWGSAIALDGDNVIIAGYHETPASEERYVGYIYKFNHLGTSPPISITTKPEILAAGASYNYGVAVGPGGSIYATGTKTYTAGGFYGDLAVVMKYGPDPNNVNNLVRKWYKPLGSTGVSAGSSIAVDSAGNAYITGTTHDGNIVTVNPVQGYGGLTDAFVAKLDADGNIVFSTFLGGSANDYGYGIALGPGGSFYVTGFTWSPEFPVLYPAMPGGMGTPYVGSDAFVTKFNTSNQIEYSTLIGTAAGSEHGQAIAVDASGSAYMAGSGSANTNDFPYTTPPGGPVGDEDVLLVKLTQTELTVPDTVAPWAELYFPEDGSTYAKTLTPTIVAVTDNVGVNSAPGQIRLFQTVGAGAETELTSMLQTDCESAASCTVSYQPADAYPENTEVTVRVEAADSSGNTVSRSFSFRTWIKDSCYWLTAGVSQVQTMALMQTQAAADPNLTLANCTPYTQQSWVDVDCDGIDDRQEALYGTDPAKKTFFIRPLMQTTTGGATTYWSWQDFKAYVPAGSNEAMARAGIELIVLGAPADGSPGAPKGVGYGAGCTYNPQNPGFCGCDATGLCGWFNPNYNPLADTNPDRPPTNIVEVILLPATVCDTGCSGYWYNNGHTYFGRTYDASTRKYVGSWTWDTRGFTFRDAGQYSENEYYGPVKIYEAALNNYMLEGAYTKLDACGKTACTTDSSFWPKAPKCTDTTKRCCNTTDCSNTLKSPLDFNHDSSVEFNTFVYYTDYTKTDFGSIKTWPTNSSGWGTNFTRAQVLKALITHELGHALLASGDSDHCSDPQCIMCGFTTKRTGWDENLLTFGGSGTYSDCTHGYGKALSPQKFIYNKWHGAAAHNWPQ